MNIKEENKSGQESAAIVSKITELTLELGVQRKNNEDLRKQLQELCANFTAYRAGHLKSSIESDVKEKRDGDSTRNNAGSDRISTSPTWGKSRKYVTPSSLEWDSKGESSTSQSDHGWGNSPARRKDRRRTPPRDDRRVERQRSPSISKFSNRDTHTKKIGSCFTDLPSYIINANEEHPKFLSLHKELGIPGTSDTKNRTVSLNFYYAKVLKLCYDHQNTLTMKETTDNAIMDIYEETIEHNKKEPNPYEHYDDSYIVSSSICKLGEHTRERRDHKKTGFRL